MNEHRVNDFLHNIISIGHSYEGQIIMLLRFIRQTYQWTKKHLPLMLRSTELNSLGMTNTIYRDLLCRANGGLPID